jgi:predicted ester cyclase
MSAEENKAIVRRYLEESWNQRNLTVIDELIVPDFIQHAAGVPQGRQGVKQFFAMIHAAFPDVHNAIEDLLAEDDKVVWRSTITGTHHGVFRGIMPTGRSVRMTAMNILRIQDGKFVENWGEQDSLGLMQQLGVIPVPGF